MASSRAIHNRAIYHRLRSKRWVSVTSTHRIRRRAMRVTRACCRSVLSRRRGPSLTTWRMLATRRKMTTNRARTVPRNQSKTCYALIELINETFRRRLIQLSRARNCVMSYSSGITVTMPTRRRLRRVAATRVLMLARKSISTTRKWFKCIRPRSRDAGNSGPK